MTMGIATGRELLTELVAKGYAFTPQSLAKVFGVSKSTVQRAIGAGVLPAVRLSNRDYRIRPERIPVDLIDAWAIDRDGIDAWPSGEIVYFIHGAQGFVKIGYTANITQRAKQLQCGCPEALQLLAYAQGGQVLERQYHKRFAHCRSYGEWFRRTPEIDAEIARLTPVQP